MAGRTNKVAIIDGFVDTLPNDHNALMAAVVRQPVSRMPFVPFFPFHVSPTHISLFDQVTISVAANTWSLYSTGVLKFEECDGVIFLASFKSESSVIKFSTRLLPVFWLVVDAVD